MNPIIYYLASLVIAAGVLYGIKLLNNPKTAVKGNRTGAVFLLLAIILTMVNADILSFVGIWIALAIGAVIGIIWATKVKMIQMPQLVSAYNGFGGAASMLVAIVLLYHGVNSSFELYSSLAAFLIGSFTFAGSMVATGKLSGKLPQKPIPFKSITSTLLVVAMILWIIAPAFAMFQPTNIVFVLVGLVISAAFGLVLTFRVGGADMPITISLLNAFSGVAGAVAGLAINDPLLVAISGIVGASGLILTQIMCRAMNRNLGEILSGKTTMSDSDKPKVQATSAQSKVVSSKKEDVSSLLNNAKRVIIVPGYGMALAQAQTQVKQLADLLESKGVEVEFAIHPVAGRMPGHMNVLLAEVDVSYERLKKMDDINPLFADTDVVIVVGANDVVNSAANTAVDTPIYGLPILEVEKAKHVIVCNFDDKPGYAGVDNPLYSQENGVTLMWGDAKDSITSLIASANQAPGEKTKPVGENKLKNALDNAKRVIIVPGYGMALAQAQTQVKQLADLLESKGIEVEFAIHPVAGRMPGHMNVLLAEVDVSYERLKEMDDINPLFADTDVAIIVGANDVVNSAANTAVDTPIYGLPILEVDKAKHVVVCNFDDKPGYAGVDNPLYTKEDGVTLMWGDAKDSVTSIISTINQEASTDNEQTEDVLKDVMDNAKRVIIVPGYGMALAQAQSQVKQLADQFESKGVEVEFAIHPVAGRMPGHMNVLLAEVDVSYERLKEMDDINPLFADTDLAIIVGANDVVNSAANTAVDTPIYGLPILEVEKAKHVVVCNFDDKPGYAGVDNPLYTQEDGVTLMWGDAKDSVSKLITKLNEESKPTSLKQTSLKDQFNDAKRVIIVPGYGMALAQAQSQVKQLSDLLENKGVEVEFAIHPVAGRMPGHMNVLLAEVDISYERLKEMDEINPLFDECDVAIIVGANDVVNSAANTAVDTPIYGLPILNVDKAKHVIVCNFDDKPGYAGVDNPLYTKEDGVTLMWGDAKESVSKIIQELS